MAARAIQDKKKTGRAKHSRSRNKHLKPY